MNRIEIENIVDEIIAKEPEKIKQIKDHPFSVGWLLGRVLTKSWGNADPTLIHEVIADKLGWNDTV